MATDWNRRQLFLAVTMTALFQALGGGWWNRNDLPQN
jgi:hypothetical protein